MRLSSLGPMYGAPSSLPDPIASDLLVRESMPIDLTIDAEDDGNVNTGALPEEELTFEETVRVVYEKSVNEFCDTVRCLFHNCDVCCCRK